MATGKVGVASATQGPGLARMTTSLIVAARSHTPRGRVHEQDGAQQRAPRAVPEPGPARHRDRRRLHRGAEAVLRRRRGAGRVLPRAARIAALSCCARRSTCSSMECDADGDDYQPSSEMFSGQQAIRPDLERLREAAGIIKREQEAGHRPRAAERCRRRRRTQRTGSPIASARWSRPRSSPRARSPTRSTTRAFRGCFPRAR